MLIEPEIMHEGVMPKQRLKFTPERPQSGEETELVREHDGPVRHQFLVQRRGLRMRSEVRVAAKSWAVDSGSSPIAAAIGSSCASNTAHPAIPQLSALSLHRAG